MKALKPNFCPLATLMPNTHPPHTACGESSSLRAVKYSSPPTPSLLPGASLSCAYNMPPTTQPLLGRQPHHTEWTLFKLSRSLDWLRHFFPCHPHVDVKHGSRTSCCHSLMSSLSSQVLVEFVSDQSGSSSGFNITATEHTTGCGGILHGMVGFNLETTYS